MDKEKMRRYQTTFAGDLVFQLKSQFVFCNVHCNVNCFITLISTREKVRCDYKWLALKTVWSVTTKREGKIADCTRKTRQMTKHMDERMEIENERERGTLVQWGWQTDSKSFFMNHHSTTPSPLITHSQSVCVCVWVNGYLKPTWVNPVCPLVWLVFLQERERIWETAFELTAPFSLVLSLLHFLMNRQIKVTQFLWNIRCRNHLKIQPNCSELDYAEMTFRQDGFMKLWGNR